ncbi:alpha/beta hydrolase [Brevibacillus ruminantium]|uniref:Alpha/beta hydrolase n=1 Tax=Brevibacillus ruminantium TaxID=2950604 RepID=A0ABY4WGU2_9BACL|nr:alpha/beta hydrolase [Brevibacillus ruminantium]USG65065.1 alpha/beta hydrolase [Brevibacillus ruminantium]
MYTTYDHEWKGLTFRIAEWTGGSPTIVGIHGLAGNHKHFTALANELSPEYRVLAYDVRGRGNSSRAEQDSSILLHAEDTIELIESLGIKSPILIGHSMGAFIAAIVASKYKNLAGVVLVDGAGLLTSKEIEIVKPALDRLGKSFPSKEAYIHHSQNIYHAMGLEWNEYFEEGILYGVEEVDGQVRFKGEPEVIMKDLESIERDFDHKQICSSIACPVLLVIANGKIGGSPVYTEESYSKTKEYTANLQSYLSDANHYSILLDRQPDLAHRIKQFIAEISESDLKGDH